tara:strand:+ start:5695 stop:6936 length:1242 start_codon:yes stop_codon:yes gene_type:complete
MKNSVELRQDRATLIADANGMVETCKTENRDFNETEQVSYDGKMESIDKLQKNIETVERQEKLNAEIAAAPVSYSTQDVSTSKELRGYSFVDAAKAAYSGRVEGLVKEMDQEARNENPNQSFRGIAIPYSVLNGSQEERAATVLTGNSAPVEVASFIDQLQANSVLKAAGANFYSGMAADRKFPIVQDIVSNWVAENVSSAPTAAGSLGVKTLAPKKIISIVDMSAESLVQNSGLEGALRRNLAASMMAKMEAALLAEGDVTSAPESIFKDAGAYSTSAAATLALVAGLEAELIANGVGLDSRTSYIFNPAAWATIAGLAGADFTGGYLDLKDKMINNTPYHVSGALGSDGTTANDKILCGDFSKVHMGIFGGLDVLFDPYTQAGIGAGRMVATGLVDGICAQNGSVMQSLIE